MKRLVSYFTEGIENKPLASSVGVEVETSFIQQEPTDEGQYISYTVLDPNHTKPITVPQSQELLDRFRIRFDWQVTQRKGNLVTQISNNLGDKFCYELGRQNIELSTAPDSGSRAVDKAEALVKALSHPGTNNYYPYREQMYIVQNPGPIVQTDEELLLIPDERDAVWLKLDGRSALELLARTSSVQFTISVPPKDAIECLNRLGEKIGSFLKDYPQEENWRRYIKESKANYHALRYGGPLFFDSIEDYCKKLIKHDVVVGPNLIPYNKVPDLDIPLYLRSIWWYFRLRRYGNTLCIEIRPLPRRSYIKFKDQFNFVMSVLSKI